MKRVREGALAVAAASGVLALLYLGWLRAPGPGAPARAMTSPPVPAHMPGVVHPPPEHVQPALVATGLPAQAKPAGPVSPGTGRDRVATLIAQLEERERNSPASFHAEAAPLLEAFCQRSPPPGENESIVRDLVAAVDGRPRSARVRGALLATLGGLGAVSQLLERIPPEGAEVPDGPGGEERRCALLGLAWRVSLDEGADGPDATAVALDPSAFLQHQPRGGLEVLPLMLDRPPSPEAEFFLRREILRPTANLDDLLTRDLAVMALGTSVDERPSTLSLMHHILVDRDANMQRLRGSVCYVLSHARSDVARGVLREFLDNDEVGGLGKTLARWWMSAGSPRPGDVDSLMAPLLDTRSNSTERLMAAGSLLRRLDVASERELSQIEDVLSWRVMDETNGSSRLAAVVTLALAPGGMQRMGALQHVLRSDERAVNRGWAAVGLGRTEAPLDQEARSMLRAALQVETDPSVRQDIMKALGDES